MNNLFAITIAIAAIGGSSTSQAGACGMNLPTFELMGFPVSPHQVAVMGSARVQESAAPSTLMLAGMPASPHQIAVLTPRLKAAKTAAAPVGIREPTTVGLTPPRPAIRTAAAGSCSAD